MPAFNGQAATDLGERPSRQVRASSPHPPPLSISDGMWIVAATSLGLAGMRLANGLPDDGQFIAVKGLIGRRLVSYSGPLLVPWAGLVVLLTLWKPWPSLRNAVGRPGFVASLAVILAAVDATVGVALCGDPKLSSLFVGYTQAAFMMTTQAGTVIFGAWLALALSGRGRPGPTWVDRLGCVVGLGYLGINALLHFAWRVIYFITEPIWTP